MGPFPSPLHVSGGCCWLSSGALGWGSWLKNLPIHGFSMWQEFPQVLVAGPKHESQETGTAPENSAVCPWSNSGRAQTQGRGGDGAGAQDGRRFQISEKNLGAVFSKHQGSFSSSPSVCSLLPLAVVRNLAPISASISSSPC